MFDRPAPGCSAFRTVDACGAEDAYEWLLRVIEKVGQRSTKPDSFTVSEMALAEAREYCERRPGTLRLAHDAGAVSVSEEPIWNADRLAVTRRARPGAERRCIPAIARLAALRFRYLAAYTKDAVPRFADRTGAPAEDSPTYAAWHTWQSLLVQRDKLQQQLARVSRRAEKAWLRYADAELERSAPQQDMSRAAPAPKYAFGSMLVPELLDIYKELFGAERLGETKLGAPFRFVASFLDECEGTYDYFEATAFSLRGSLQEHFPVFGPCHVGSRLLVESLRDEPLNRQVQDGLAIIKRRPRLPAISREVLTGRLPLVSGAFVNTRTKAQKVGILRLRSGIAPRR